MRNLTVLSLLAFVLAPVHAAGNMQVGAVSIKPYIQSEQKLDSNIYLTDTGEIDSWINQTGVGAVLGAKFKDRHSLDLGYQADFVTYSKAPKANNAVHQLATLALTFVSANDDTCKLTDMLQDTTDPAASSLVDRERRLQNDAGIGYAHKSETGLGYGIDLAHTLHDYDSSALSATLDRQEYRAGGNLSYPIGGQTKATLGYGFTQIAYKDGDTNKKDNTGHEATLGVDGRIANKVTGQASAGYNTRSYKDEIAGLRNSFSTLSYGLNLTWDAAERTQVALGGKRGFGEGTFSSNRFYNMSVADLAVTQKFLDKFTARLSGTYESDMYPEDSTLSGKTAKREDTIAQGGLTLDYAIQDGFKVGVSYLYRMRDSNFSIFDYNDSIVGVNFKLAL